MDGSNQPMPKTDMDPETVQAVARHLKHKAGATLTVGEKPIPMPLRRMLDKEKADGMTLGGSAPQAPVAPPALYEPLVRLASALQNHSDDLTILASVCAGAPPAPVAAPVQAISAAPVPPVPVQAGPVAPAVDPNADDDVIFVGEYMSLSGQRRSQKRTA